MPLVLVALGLGVIVLLATSKGGAAPAAPPVPYPGPAPAPTGFLAPITDAATVLQYQTAVAASIGAGKWIGPQDGPGIPQMTTADYSSMDVDGNPANAKWMRVLQIFQTVANAKAPWPQAPAGFPTALRTDGVLDYATSIILVNA